MPRNKGIDFPPKAEPESTEPEPFVSSVEAPPMDATPAENRNALAEAVERVKKIVPERAPVNRSQEFLAERRREILDESQEKYFSALVEHHRKRGFTSVALEALSGLGSGVANDKELRSLRSEWIDSRAKYRDELTRSVQGRIREKYTDRQEVLDSLRNKHSARIEGETYEQAVQERYNRMIANRTAVIGAAEQELAAKKEGLSLRERKFVDRQFEAYKSWHPAKRVLVSAALLTGGSAAFSAAITGGVALSALLLAGTAASATLHLTSERLKSSSPKAAKFFGVVAGLTSLAGIAGAAGETLVRGAHKVAGTEKRAQKNLVKNIDDDMGSSFSLKRAIDEREKNITVEERVARQSLWGRIAGSIFGGAVLGNTLGNATSAEAAPDSIDSNGTEPAADAPDNSASTAEAGANANSASSDSIETPPTATAPTEVSFSALVDRPGEGTDSLFLDLKNQIEAANVPEGEQSPVLKHILESHQNELSRGMGEVQYGMQGMLTQPGDSLFMDANQNVWLQPEGGQPQLYLENTNGGQSFAIHEIEGRPLITEPAQQEVPQVTAQEVSNAGQQQTGAAVSTASVEQHSQVAESAVNEQIGSIEQQESAPVVPAGNQSATNVASEQVQVTADQSTRTAEQSRPQEPGIQSLEDWVSSQEQGPMTLGDLSDSSPASYTNDFGVEINTAVPAIYTFSLEGSESAIVVAHGGSAEASEQLAREYAMRHPGTVVQFAIENREPVTGEIMSRTVGTWEVNANGEMIRNDNIASGDGTILSPASTDTFTRKLN